MNENICINAESKEKPRRKRNTPKINLVRETKVTNIHPVCDDYTREQNMLRALRLIYNIMDEGHKDEYGKYE